MSAPGIDSLVAELHDIDGQLRRDAGLDAAPSPDEPLDALDAAASTIALVRLSLSEGHATPPETTTLMLRSLRGQHQLRQRISSWHMLRLTDLAKAVEHVSGAATVAAVRHNACVAATRELGYRTSSFAVAEDDGWVVTDLGEGDDTGRTVRSSWNSSPAEHVSVTEGSVIHVRDSAEATAPICTVLDADAYTVVPIIAGTDRIGLLHCARPPTGVIGFVEIEVLHAFGTAVAAAYSRSRRIEDNRRRRRSIIETACLLDELADAIPCSLTDLDNAPDGHGLDRRDTDDRAIPPRRRPPIAPSPVEDLLTAREREVYRLLVTGAANRDIAEYLVISVETVKSHVKQILRKVGAINRAELLSLHMQHR